MLRNPAIRVLLAATLTHECFLYAQQYAFKRHGEPAAWRATTRRDLPFASQSPGEPRLERSAFHSAGGWSAAPATLAVRIQPAWRHTLWFRGGILGLLALAALLAWRLLHRSAATRRALESAVAERTAELDEAKMRVNVMFENSPDGYFLCNSAGTILDSNRATRDLTGYGRNEINGRTYAAAGVCPPESLPIAARMLARNIAGESAGPEELVLIHKDGSRLDVEIRTFPVEIRGRTFMLGSLRDIGPRKRAEEAGRASERRLRELLETVNLAAVTLDERGGITFCNDYLLRLTGRSAAEVLGGDWFDLFVPEEQRSTVRSMFQESLARAGIPEHYENAILTRDGGRRLIEWDNTMLRDQEGRVVGTASLGRDVTDHRALEERYREAQRLESIGRLAGGVAHDFNNLLLVINGYSQLLLQDLPPADPNRALLSEIRDAGERAAGLTGQLLAFSRRQVLQPTVLDLNTVVREAGRMLERVIGEHITLETRLDPGLGSVLADAGQIHQALMNLAINARDAMPRGGALIISTAKDVIEPGSAEAASGLPPGPGARLIVTDSGDGMDEETLSHAFEPFFTTKAHGKGTGLGLSMVYGIVRQSNGMIAVSSEPGRGSTFAIVLPCVASPATEPDKPAKAGLPRGGAETILLVEDQPDVRDLVGAILSHLGYRVIPAAGGQQALELARQQAAPPDLVVTDVVMPGMTGFEMAAGLGSTHPGVPVLFMSGYSAPAIFEGEMLPAGTEYLQKPFTPEVLASRVRAILDARRSC